MKAFVDGLIWTIIVIMICIAGFSKHYSKVFDDMISLITAAFVPIFLIILAIAFFVGGKVVSLVGMPGIKPVFVFLILLILVIGVSSTLGNDLNTQLTGKSVKATDVIFTKEVLNLSFVLIIGISIFIFLLVKES